MARAVLVWSVSTLACLASASGASAASRPQERHGFWIGFGFGPGSANVSCDDCGGTDRETSVAGNLRLGGTINEHLLFGGEFDVWTKEQEDTTFSLYNAVATLTVYPQPSAGFFFKAGVGFSFVDTRLREGSTTVTVDLGNGLGLLAGVGYDLRVGKNISVTPAVSFWYGQQGDITLAGETVFRNWKHNVVDFTVGVTFH